MALLYIEVAQSVRQWMIHASDELQDINRCNYRSISAPFRSFLVVASPSLSANVLSRQGRAWGFRGR
jgi:hypothetical protein